MHCSRSIVGCVCALLLIAGAAWAESDQAAKLRSRDGLAAYTPPEAFLAGNFLANEEDPAFLFGKVGDFAGSRTCKTTWLIEDGERQRIAQRGPQADAPLEYTLYLEEDCPGRVAYYVFVDRSQGNSKQWLEWRRQFHKTKAEPHYGASKVALEAAAQAGYPVDAELRFLEVNGELLMKKPEDVLTGELNFKPVYDLKQQKALGR